MKKILLYSIIFILILILLKYGLSNYKMEYSINNYNISMNYKNKRFYYEIKKNDIIYNFDIYKNRSFTKQKISQIKEINGEDFNCIVPIIKSVNTYPLCYKNNEFIDFYLIDSELLNDYKKEIESDNKSNKDFIYFNNLSNNDYIALWNYKGYIVMNGKNYSNVDLFENDKYDNSYAYLLKNTIYMPNYDEEHEYSTLVGFNIEDLSVDTFDIGYKIDYDSYIVGSIGNKLYIFDDKYSILYEIDVKNYNTSIVGNNEKGFVKYEKGKFISCSKSEYKINKIKYNDLSESIYKYNFNNGTYKTVKDNKTIIQKVLNKDVSIVKEKDNEFYYINEDYLYKYDPYNGNRMIFYNYELKFNYTNTVFIYNK